VAATETPPRAATPTPADVLPRAEPPATPTPGRDVSLDLLRGLAMAILVVNHVPLRSWLHYATEPFLSAAEALVVVSGVIAGMVFGRRWVAWGARATTRALLHRSLTLYRASVCVVAIVGALTLVPGVATEALTIAPRTDGPDLYAFEGPARTALAIVTLEAGPWQFNILGFFIAAIALTPALLWLLDRGWWPALLAASWALFLLGRATLVEVLPTQSERPFPFLIWQILFVHGAVLGWYRDRVARALGRVRRLVAGAILAVAAVAAYTRLHEIGVDPLGLDALLGFDAADWRRWDHEHFDKRTLDAGRLVTMLAFTAAAYVAFRRFEPLVARTAGRLLLPLGRASFYVFITQVFLCLAVATLPLLADGGFGRTANTAAQIGCLALLCLMVRRRFLFRWIPR
jgi:hypothetical protein